MRELPDQSGGVVHDDRGAQQISAVGADVPTGDRPGVPWVPQGVVSSRPSHFFIRPGVVGSPEVRQPARAAADTAGAALHQRLVTSLPHEAIASGFPQTQESVMQNLTTKLADVNDAEADAVIIRVNATETICGVTIQKGFWARLDHLMRETEAVTGEPERYTPEQFVASLAPYAAERAAQVVQADTEKQAQGVGISLELTPEQRVELAGVADEVLDDPAYLHNHNITHIQRDVDDLARIHPDLRATAAHQEAQTVATQQALEQLVVGTPDWDTIHGAMRSDPNCGYHTAGLIEALDARNTGMVFLEGNGPTGVLTEHYVVLALPDEASR